MEKDIILSLSGGLDSSSLLFEFKERIKLAISFRYGSNHEKLEINAAKKVIKEVNKLGYNIEHRIIDLRAVFKGFKSALLSGSDQVPNAEYDQTTISQLVVPFRNGIFLSILAGLAESNNCEYIALANHANDSTTYPDCRPEFIENMFKAIQSGTDQKVKLFAPYTNITKNDIALRGLQNGLNFKWTYSCYKGFKKECGECPTCVEKKAAIEYAQRMLKWG